MEERLQNVKLINHCVCYTEDICLSLQWLKTIFGCLSELELKPYSTAFFSLWPTKFYHPHLLKVIMTVTNLTPIMLSLLLRALPINFPRIYILRVCFLGTVLNHIFSSSLSSNSSKLSASHRAQNQFHFSLYSKSCDYSISVSISYLVRALNRLLPSYSSSLQLSSS